MFSNLGFDIAIWAIGILFAIGAVYGDIRARLNRVEDNLGKNGTDGIFTRRTETDLLIKGIDGDMININKRMDRMQTQINEIIERQVGE